MMQQQPTFVLRSGHTGAVDACAFAPGLARLLATGDASGTMVLWNLHTYLPMVEWPAHDHGNGSHHQILAAYFLTPNRLLTHGRNDGLAVWDTWGYASAAIDAPLTVPDRCAAATAPPPRLLGRMEIVNGGFCAASVVPVDREQAMVVVPAMDDTQRFDVFLLRTPASNDGSGPVRFTAIARNVGVATWSDKPVGQLLGLEWFLPHSARASSMVTPSVMAIYESGTCVVYSWDTPPNKSGSSEPGATVPPKCPPQPRFGVSLETDPLLACTVDAKGKVGVVGTVTGSAWMFELEPANHDAIVTQQIWGPINAATAANETSDEAEPRPISSVAVSPDNKRIALACHDGSIQLVKRSTGAPVARLDPPAGGGGGSAKIRRVKWSGSGPLTLAAAYDDGTIALWTLP